MILSASRRTDIPAFYTDWFLQRLREGEVLVRHPFRFRQVSRIPITRETVDAIVFWSKDPAPLLARLTELDAFRIPYLIQFTLTPYGPDLERRLRKKEAIVDTFVRLAERLGPERVLWRYDPILLNGEWSAGRHAQAFGALCRRLRGSTRRCTVSFVDMYPAIQKAARGLFRAPEEDEMRELAGTLAAIGRENGITPQACCEKLDMTPYGIEAAGCIDRQSLERLCGYALAARPHAGQREGCRCMESVDIGAYGTCGNGCVYCYANRGRTVGAHPQPRPDSPLLAGELEPGDHVTDRKAASLLRDGQLRWSL